MRYRCDEGLMMRGGWALLFVGLLAGVAVAGSWPPAPPLEVEMATDPGRLPPSVQAEMADGGLWHCTFRFKPGPDAQSVTLAGTFNGWNSTTTRLRGPRGDGYWMTSVDLAPGRHEYKFVVDGGAWFPDPENPDGADDQRGGSNSLLRLGELANLSVSEAQRGDGRINAMGIEHRGELPLYFQPLATDRMLLRCRVLANDVQRAWVAVKGGELTPMHLARETPMFDLYEADVRLSDNDDPDVTTIRYTFVFEDGNLRASAPNVYSKSFADTQVFKTPDWAKHTVWYQIMPERFRNGDPSNDVQPAHPWTSDWFTAQPWEKEREAQGQSFYNWYVFDRMYGGDFDGLAEKLGYLKKLGVGALYLNPVFIAQGHHKYNTRNYLHIDPCFGAGPADDYDKITAGEDLNDPATWKWTKSDKRFLKLIEQVHAAGLHIIIDGVFNHVGTAHPAFVDVLEKKQDSPYADWFSVTSWEPFEYVGWGGFDALPEFRKSANGLASEEAKQHIFNVTRRWMDPDGDGDPRDGIDGWRLDVPGSIPAPFWVEWRALVKSINPDAYITGEIWDRADTWLDGEHFDAVMNYEFANAVVRWIIDHENKISVSEFDRRLTDLRLAYPLPATLVLQNLMDSHDTDRLVSMVINPDRQYDDANRVQDSGPNYNNDKPPAEAYRRARLIVLLQMTYIGAPMIFYGDEAGMWGADDPTCRKPMLWQDLEPYEKPEENSVITEHLAHYQKAIALRNAHPALRTGLFETLLVDDERDVWAFLRSDANEQLVVALNASDKPREISVKLPKGSPSAWQGVWGEVGALKSKADTLTLQLPPVDGVVVRAATPK